MASRDPNDTADLDSILADVRELEAMRDAIKALHDKTIQQFAHHEMMGEVWECNVYCDYANRLRAILAKVGGK